jgi:hypothetical protein
VSSDSPALNAVLGRWSRRVFGGSALGPLKMFACGLSNEIPAENLLLNSLMKRNCGFHVQSKPGTNDPSIVIGTCSECPRNPD